MAIKQLHKPEVALLLPPPTAAIDPALGAQSAALPLEIEKQDGGNFSYNNRKQFSDTRVGLAEKLLELIPKLPEERAVRVFDFNFDPGGAAMLGLPIRNLIPLNATIDSYDINWAMRPGASPSAALCALYQTWVDEGATGKLLHIDHHYDAPAVALTSTTPMTLGLIQWARANGHDAFLARLASAHGFFDHSDADIVLSHFLASHATNGEYIDQYGALLAQVAIMNDHLVMPQDRLERETARILYGVVLSVEDAILHGNMTPGRAFTIVEEAAPFATRCVYQLGATEQSLVELHDNGIRLQFEDPYGLYDMFREGARHGEFERAILNGFQKFSGPPANDALYPENSMSRVGDLIVVNFADPGREIAGSQVVMALLTQHAKLSEGARVILTCYPAEGGFYIKLRSVISPNSEFFDLNEAYRDLRATLPPEMRKAPNGRATAGGMGKSPIQGDRLEYLRLVAAGVADSIAKVQTPH